MTVQAPPQLLSTSPRIADWIALESSGRITILSGRVELGQGNLTALLQIAADELNCAVDTLGITPAHTGVTPDEGFTAGSVSISAGGAAVRWAAAALRSLLLSAGERRSGVDAGDLALSDHRVVSKDGQVSLSIGALADDIDMTQAIVGLAHPKPPSERWSAGRDVARIDLRDRMVKAPFVHDLEFPDMLYGQPAHPPAVSARLISCDLDGLRARPGVVEVVLDGSFLGVIADSPFAAARAARWAGAQAKWDVKQTGTQDEVGVIAASEEPAETVFASGDMAIAEGQEFQTLVTRPYLFHASIGTSAAVARVDGDRVTVWSHSQGVYQLRGAIAQALETSEENVEVQHSPGSGCYGHNGADDAAFDAVLLARAVPGRPVKVVWS